MITTASVQDLSATSQGFPQGEFLFVVCQHGTEPILKRWVLAPNSPFRLAFSRRGFLTFKVVGPEHCDLPHHPLIRLSGRVFGKVLFDASSLKTDLSQAASLGKTSDSELVENQSEYDSQESRPTESYSGDGGSTASLLGYATSEAVARVVSEIPSGVRHLHVFQRDERLVGDRGYEPGDSQQVRQLVDLFQQQCPATVQVNQIAAVGEAVMDCIIIQPGNWILGHHRAARVESCWPGGCYPVTKPQSMISRAYLKMAEALAWSELPWAAGDRVVEIGSAPGGASQRLLDMGLIVTGVDPAAMDAQLLEHPRFEHWRGKSSTIKRKNYSKFKWLVADANVAPNYTLDCVGDIATYPTSRLQGMILTLKLSDYELLGSMSDYINRIRSWGFSNVRVRQLSHNRREVCVVAARP